MKQNIMLKRAAALAMSAVITMALVAIILGGALVIMLAEKHPE